MPRDVPPFTPELTVLDNGVSLLNAPSSSRNSGVFLIVRAGGVQRLRAYRKSL